MASKSMRWRHLSVAMLALGGCARKAPEGDLFVSRTKGLIYLEQDQLKEAEAEFRIVVALAPGDPLGFANLGLVHLRAGRLREAEKEIRRALERDSTLIEPTLTLATIYQLTGRRDAATRLLLRHVGQGPGDARVLYMLAGLADSTASGTDSTRKRYLERLVAQSPGNHAARLALTSELLRRGEVAGAMEQLEAFRQLLPTPPAEALPLYAETLRLLRGPAPDSALGPFQRFRGIMEVTPAYQESLRSLAGPLGPMVGMPVLTFRPYYEIRERVTQGVDTVTPEIRFDDGTGYSRLSEVGIPAGSGPLALAAGDYDGDGGPDVLVAGGQLFRNDYSRFARVDASGLAPGLQAAWAEFADYDNDGRLDLAILDSGGALRLFHNQVEEGREPFREVTSRARLDEARGRMGRFADLDHDGDLDLLLAGSGGIRVFRNNLDGTFREMTREAGFGGGSVTGEVSGVAFADFTGDGLLDLVVTGRTLGARLLRNLGGLRFEEVGASSGLDAMAGAAAVAAGDSDNDGLLDLVVIRTDGTPVSYRGEAGGRFEPDPRAAPGLLAARDSSLTGAAFLDYDNDGHLDLVLSGPTRLALLRNDGSGMFVDRSALLGPGPHSAGSLLAADLDRDGDVDLLVQGPLRLLRNDGGNANQYVRVELKGLGAGSGKNNSFGIGARLELRAGELYQTRVATDPVTLFGIGKHLKADVIRVTWPNGIPQTIYLPGTDQNVLEEQVLKSSCLFLYAWDGSGTRFVTDVMWKSALGMPVGIGGGGTSALAPAAASVEYLRIPGGQLKPRDGRYLLQFTEELWETAYLDQVRLLAVDHPDTVQVFVDERFGPGSPTTLELHQVVGATPPVSAVDNHGVDLLPALRARDDRYTGGLLPGAFQGLMELHDLVLDPGPGRASAPLLLVLRGWVFPTDASINASLLQSSRPGVLPPSVAVPDGRGGWRTIIPNLGFPSGKDKTLIVDLTGRFPTADHRVRLRTSMDIHWDQAFFATSASGAPVRVTQLDPVAADLHYRGFSRMYRKGGRAGPHWFDYDSVSTEARWFPIRGLLTRFGDVLPLLTATDDRTLVMGPGDEATVHFPADRLPAVPPGWSRDFLIHTVGWIKDGEFNTADGGTIEPLPFHAMRRYPYAPHQRYPDDTLHRNYVERWNTRSGGGRLSEKRPRAPVR